MGAMTADRPWFAGEAAASQPEHARLHAPATERNRDAIADILAQELPDNGLVLEVASGSGEHALHFARLFPALDWQPSDPDPAALASIAAWTALEPLPNLLAPIALDAALPLWPMERPVHAVLCINMTHISPWEACLGLFAGAARLLDEGAPLILYGPFLQAGVETAPSNLAFDRQLRQWDAGYGLRSVEDLDRAAAEQGLSRTTLHPMPANNLMIVNRVSRRARRP